MGETINKKFFLALPFNIINEIKSITDYNVGGFVAQHAKCQCKRFAGKIQKKGCQNDLLDTNAISKSAHKITFVVFETATDVRLKSPQDRKM